MENWFIIQYIGILQDTEVGIVKGGDMKGRERGSLIKGKGDRMGWNRCW